MEELVLCSNMQRMIGIDRQSLTALKLGVQAEICTALVARANLQRQQSRNLTHQGFQQSGNKLDGGLFVDPFCTCKCNNVFDPVLLLSVSYGK